MQIEPNAYSHRWFEFFHFGIPDARTAREITFICECAPLPEFQRVLDVCCGTGRHARALSSRGYSIVGVDRDPDAIAKARDLGGGPTYVHADVREYAPPSAAFDIAIVMSQSFGYFDRPTNFDVLSRLAAGLRTGGRLILDLWSPQFFAVHQADRKFETAGGVVSERKRVDGGRLLVQLEYPDGGQDRFEWQLFSHEEMAAFAQPTGLMLSVACTNFDPATRPSPKNPRIQFLFERM